MRLQLSPRPKPLGPENSPDEIKKDALRADSALREIVKNLRGGKQQLFIALAGLVGSPDECDANLLVWDGLTQLANAPMSSAGLHQAVIYAMRGTLALCVTGHEELEDLQGTICQLEFFQDLAEMSSARTIELEDAFALGLLDLQPKIRQLLRWVADPNRLSKAERSEALSFLIENGEVEPAEYSYEPNDEFDDSGNVGYPLFFWRRPQSFQSVITPVASYIFSRLERYHNREITLTEAVPIVLCKAPNCGRLTISKRRTKDFCSDTCRASFNQKLKPAETAAAKKQYRLDNYTKPFPRKRKPKNDG